VFAVFAAVRQSVRNDRVGSNPDQEGDEIDKMTPFPDNPSTTDFGLLGPMIQRNSASIHSVMDVHGFSTTREERGKGLCEGSKSAIETNREKRLGTGHQLLADC